MKAFFTHSYHRVSFVIMIIILSFGIQTRAQIKQRKSIIISGKVTQEIKKEISKNPEVLIYQEMITGTNSNLNRSYPVKFTGNTFTVSINPTADCIYFQIQFLPVEQLGRYYLAQPSDSIYLDIHSKYDFNFTSNSPLFSYQLKLSSLTAQYESKYSKDLKSLENQKNNVIKEIDHETLKYENQIPAEIIELIHLNYESEVNFYYIQKLSNSFAVKDRVQNTLTYDVATQINDDYNQQTILNNFIIKNSIYYVMYRLELEKLQNIIHTSSDGQKKDRFQSTLNSIRNRYSGLLREKLLTYFFLKSFKTSGDTVKLLDSIVNNIHDPLYKKILLNLQKVNTSGNPAYSFSLESTDGKRYSLAEFRGKIVFCKFWFNGCGGCAKLELDLKPLKTAFKDSQDVVFISINVDSDKNNWIKGIEKGIYSSNHDLQLSTFPQGVQHPLIEFYHYHGFPQMLLVDKKGQIIASNPQRPTDKLSLLKLEKLIRSYF